jgi:hypothetical protein
MGQSAHHKVIADISLNYWKYNPSLLYPDNQTALEDRFGTGNNILLLISG